MKALLFAALFALSGCAAGYTENAVVDTVLGGGRAAARQFPLGDGRTGYEVTCDGARTLSACYQRASHYCPQGFDVLNSSQDAGAATAQRSLMFVCRPT